MLPSTTRRTSTRLLTLGAGVVAVALALTACSSGSGGGSASGGGDKNYKITFLPKNLGNPYFDTSSAGAKEAIDEFGGEFADARLGQATQRKPQEVELIAHRREQEIALVARRIRGAMEFGARRPLDAADVMAGRQAISA